MPTLGTTKALDRASNRRADDAWIKAQVENAASRFVMLVDRKPAIVAANAGTSTTLRWFSRGELLSFGLKEHPVWFLGVDQQGRASFALDITDHRANAVPGGPFILRPYVDLRSLAMQGALSAEDLSLAGQARALAEWHQNARCCGHCGSTTDIKDGGWRRKCWSCGREHFPRTDPVVIMLVVREDQCLLAHAPRFNDKMYSALAGFLEPGEDIEHAVRREVMEEVGIEIGRVTYQESQPWPFPHSLMIGCAAEALTGTITIRDEEIDDARWFSRADAKAMLDGRHAEGFSAPGKHAIANKLLRAFIES